METNHKAVASLGSESVQVLGKKILTEPGELLRRGRVLLGGTAREDEFFAWNYVLTVLAIGPEAQEALPELEPGDKIAVKAGHGDSFWFQEGKGFNLAMRGRRVIFIRDPEHVSHGIAAG